MSLRVLQSDTCEGLKLGVHGVTLGLVTLMCLYNAAAWLQRRQRHLAINALTYGGAIILEQQHVAHHWRALCRLQVRMQPATGPAALPPPVDERRAA